jgi:hypothetical protein
MAEILFENITGTRLYRPVSPASNEALLFLSTTPGKTRSLASLSLDKTWDDEPIGYYLFLKKLPDDDSKFAAQAEEALDLAAHPPKHSSFAWLAWDGKTVTVVANVVIKPEASGDPVVETDTVISIPGFPGIGVAEAAPVLGEKDGDGFLNGFSLAYPPQMAHAGQPASRPPWGASVTVPMAGIYAGCIRFEALLNAPKSSSGNAVRKQVAVVSLDPVRPTDSRRTRISLTDVLLDFGQLPSGAFYLEPANAGTASH